MVFLVCFFLPPNRVVFIGSKGNSGEKVLQEASSPNSCSQQEQPWGQTGCSGLCPGGSWKPPKTETVQSLQTTCSADLLSSWGKHFSLTSSLKLSFFKLYPLPLILPPHCMLQGLALSPRWLPHRHWCPFVRIPAVISSPDWTSPGPSASSHKASGPVLANLVVFLVVWCLSCTGCSN